MLVIGLAGGIASGKSLVASCFQQLGATVLDADRIGHEVLRDPEVVAAIVLHWGEQVVNQGEIDRSALGRLVFGSSQGDTSQLRRLEQITHPRIGQRIQQKLAELKSESESQKSEIPAVVLDAPVMFKAGWDNLCDKIVFVDSNESLRQLRAKQRGWPIDELARRESYQTPIDEKRRRSTDIIQNSQSKLETFEQVRRLWQQWNLRLPKTLDFPSSLFPN